MKRIPIFYAVDDNYINVLKVSIHSLIKYANKNRNYTIYILNAGLSIQSKKTISELRSHKFHIHFFNVSAQIDILAKKLNVRDYYTMTTYYRLITPNAFPYLKKAVYLDCDTLLRGDVSKLYDQDIGDDLLGAVCDSSVLLYKEFSLYVEKALKIRKDRYFNAGVLIMNLEQMRKMHFQNIITELVKEVSFKVAQDQDLLNVVCKDKVTYLDPSWNQMPFGEKNQFPNLIHFNLMYKPWKLDNIMYEDYFWNEAIEAKVKDQIWAYKKSLPLGLVEVEKAGVQKVKDLCLFEVKRTEYYTESLSKLMEIEKSERSKILEKIKVLEKEGKFDVDVENDPPYKPLEAGDVDYLRKGLLSKLKAHIAVHTSRRYFNSLIRKGDIVIDSYEGIENLKRVKTGAIITANHFSPFDSIPINKVMAKYKHNRKLFTIIREGNYTFPGLYGYFMRNCNTLPLAGDLELMRQFLDAVNTILKKGHYILIYAEQSMWWNYRKPKPTKNSAFKFAVRNNVPVIPTFITMRDTDKLDKDGYPIQAYTLHILNPIYPDPTATEGENVINIKKANDEAVKEVYEKVYQKPLSYKD